MEEERNAFASLLALAIVVMGLLVIMLGFNYQVLSEPKENTTLLYKAL